jgi:hypothetical protein
LILLADWKTWNKIKKKNQHGNYTNKCEKIDSETIGWGFIIAKELLWGGHQEKVAIKKIN